MASQTPQPAAFETDKPVGQSKDTSMGYPVAVATPATPPAAVPNRRPKAWLYGTAVALAIVALIAQPLFMNSKLIIKYYGYGSGYSSGYGSGYGSGYSYPSSSSYPSSYPTYPTSSSYPTSAPTPSFTNPIASGIDSIGSGIKNAAAPSNRKLLGKKKSSTKYKSGGGSSYTYTGNSASIKGKAVAKAPGMVIAAAVIALVAAIPFLVFLCVPRLGASQWTPVAEAVVAFVVLVLWLASMGVSAKSADVLHDIKKIAPKAWLAGNAIALTCSILSLFVWGALLALAVKQLLPWLRARKGGAAPAAPAAPQPAEAPAAHTASYAAGVPTAQEVVHPAAAPHPAYAVPAGGPPAPGAGYPAAAPADGVVYNPAYPAGQYPSPPAAPAAAVGAYPPPSQGAY